jgi:hypothetical protein
MDAIRNYSNNNRASSTGQGMLARVGGQPEPVEAHQRQHHLDLDQYWQQEVVGVIAEVFPVAFNDSTTLPPTDDDVVDSISSAMTDCWLKEAVLSATAA